MRVLVLGAYGMLGHKLMQVLDGPFEVYATARVRRDDVPDHVVRKDRLVTGVTAESTDTVTRAIADLRPAAVINCIGLVKQREAAKDPIPSLEINALFPHRLAVLCRAARARFVHFSTDCVFSGRKGAYRETDTPDAEDLYGLSKRLGEVSDPGCVTVRSSIIGPELGGGVGLLDWFLRNRGGRVKGFTRAIYSGLTTVQMARVVGHILKEEPDLSGVWQVASEPISKFDLLRLIDRRFGLGIDVEPDSGFECDRSLDGTRFAQATRLVIPPWEAMIDEMAKDLERQQVASTLP